MRAILVDWLVQVHSKFRLLQETLYMCVAIMDRFLQVNVASGSWGQGLLEAKSWDGSKELVYEKPRCFMKWTKFVKPLMLTNPGYFRKVYPLTLVLRNTFSSVKMLANKTKIHLEYLHMHNEITEMEAVSCTPYTQRLPATVCVCVCVLAPSHET